MIFQVISCLSFIWVDNIERSFFEFSVFLNAVLRIRSRSLTNFISEFILIVRSLLIKSLKIKKMLKVATKIDTKCTSIYTVVRRLIRINWNYENVTTYRFPTLVDLENEGYRYSACSNPLNVVWMIVLVITLVIKHQTTLALPISSTLANY